MNYIKTLCNIAILILLVIATIFFVDSLEDTTASNLVSDTGDTQPLDTTCGLQVNAPADEKKFLAAKQEMEKFGGIIQKYSTEKIDANLIKSIITQESGGNPDAENKRAIGLMQIVYEDHKETCKSYCNVKSRTDLKDPEKNICCGEKILELKNKEYFNGCRQAASYPQISNLCEKCTSSSQTGSTPFYMYTGKYAIATAYHGWGCNKDADIDYAYKIKEYYESYSKNCFSEGITPFEKIGIGKYFINPSFKTKIGYNFEDYKVIKEEVNGLLEGVRKCEEETGQTTEECLKLNLKLNSNGNYIWNLGCDDESEKLFYYFIESYERCLNSANNKCFCIFDMNSILENGDYTLKMDESTVDLIFKMEKEGLYYKLKNALFLILKDSAGMQDIIGSPVKTQIEYNLGYVDNDLQNSYMVINKKEFVLGDHLLLYKNPFGEVVLLTKEQYNQLTNIGACKLEQKRTFRICVDTKKKIEVYDKIKDKVKEKNLIIKFALYFPEK